MYDFFAYFADLGGGGGDRIPPRPRNLVYTAGKYKYLSKRNFFIASFLEMFPVLKSTIKVQIQTKK